LQEGTLNMETKMPSKAKLAFATLLVFGSASAVLAESNNGTNHRGPVVRGRTSPTMFEQRNATTSHAVKPFTAEEKAWFDRASRVF
jgi:hypothetical protein